MSAAERDAIEAFKRDVIEPSMTALVILDFWAEWCGPCKALSPVLEKVAADYAGKGVVLAKINVDEDKMIAAQFQVRSIPTVYAVFQGQIVADLTNARSEGQLKQTLDQILRQLPVAGEAQQQAEELAPLIAMGEEVLASGDSARAHGIFAQLMDMAPEQPAVIAGLAQALMGLGDLPGAQAVLDAAPADAAKDAAIERARAALAIAATATPVADTSALDARLAANPDDHDARYELAGGMLAAGDRDGAAEQLLDLIRRDRDWNDGAARERLLQLFSAVGLEDPWVGAQRRKLSAILFG